MLFEKSLYLSQKRPILTLMVVMTSVILGLLSLSDLSFVSIDKKVYPGIAIRVEANGFDATRTESEITIPLEKILSQVGAVRKMTSISEDGSSLLQLQLEDRVDLKGKSLEIREKIDTILSIFPKDVHKPQVFRYDPTLSPLLVLSFSKENMHLNEIRELVDKSFKKDLESIEGVSQVIVSGGKIREIQVSCDANQLEAYSLSLRDIVEKLQDINQNHVLGKLEETKEERTLQTKDRWKDMIRIKDIPVSVDGFGRTVYLENIAQVKYEAREEITSARLNAEEKVTIFLYKNEISDPIQISKEVRNILAKRNESSVHIEWNQDESLVLSETISTLTKLSSLLLFSLFLYFLYQKKIVFIFLPYLISISSALCFVIFFYKIISWKATLSGVFGIFFGCLIWFLFRIREIKVEKNHLSMKRKLPKNNFLFSLLISLLCSYSLSESVFIFYLVFVSHLIAIFSLLDIYFPVYFAHIPSLKTPDNLPVSLPFWNLYKKVGHTFFKKASSFCRQFEDQLTSNPALLPVSFMFLLFLSLFHIAKLDFYDHLYSEEKKTVAILEFPSGSSFLHTNEVTLALEKKLLTISGIKQVVSKIDPSHSLLLIALEEGVLPDRDFLGSVKKKVGSIEDGFLYFASELESSYFQEIVIDVIGYDQKELESITQSFAEKAKNLEGVSEAVLRYKQSRDELQLIPKKESFMYSRINYPLFGDEIRLALLGGIATKFIDIEKEVDVRVRYQKKFRDSQTDFKNIRIKNLQNQFVPISEIVNTSEDKIPMKYYHKNRNRMLSFAVKLEGNDAEQRQNVIQYLKSQPLPEGYHLEVEGENPSIFTFQNQLFFLLYPFLFLGLYLLYEEKEIKLIRLFITYCFPFYLSIFFLVFIFSANFYLPFQIGMLFSLPLIYEFISRRYHLSKAIIGYIVYVSISLLILSDSAMISFFYIWTCFTIFFLIITQTKRFCRHSFPIHSLLLLMRTNHR